MGTVITYLTAAIGIIVIMGKTEKKRYGCGPHEHCPNSVQKQLFRGLENVGT